tara:strand:+ start:5926 stop:7332 length:1407 start_codon:yes stop_codon:yes gene_type:complete
MFTNYANPLVRRSVNTINKTVFVSNTLKIADVTNIFRKNISRNFSFLAQHYEGVFPKDKFQPIKGNGAYLIDKNNKKVLCCNSAYGAAITGYGPNYVTEKLKEQSDTLATSSRAFHYETLDEYSEKLASIYQNVLHRNVNNDVQFVFKVTGAEACDTAIKIAKLYGAQIKGIEDGKQKILYAGGKNLFHGRSEAVMPPAKKSDNDPMTKGFGQVEHPTKILIELNNLEQLEEAFNDPNLAGVILEPMLGEGGVEKPEKRYLEKIRQLCDKNDVIFIYDEVQTALRTGHVSATQHKHYENAKGDIIVAAKAVTAGVYPSSYVVGKKSIMSLLKPGSEGSTFAANQLACAVGLATIKMIEDDNVLMKIQVLGDRIKNMLNELKESFPLDIQKVKGLGGMIGLELSDNETAKVVKTFLLTYAENDISGIHVKIAGDNKTLRISPNTAWGDKEISLLKNGLEKGLSTIINKS